MKQQTLLSVDWDFFFPNAAWFDWGHMENPLFYETIWWTRCASFHLKTHQPAIEVMVPDARLVQTFWKTVLRGKPNRVLITNSHLELYRYLEQIYNGRPCLVDNYDAHHDLGYDSNFKDVDCGNWAGRALVDGLMENYRLFYPEWRREEPEGGNISPEQRVARLTGLNTGSKRYDHLFICRSSAWTPTWADHYWLEFISPWRSSWRFGRRWITGLSVGKARRPTMADANLFLLKSRKAHAQFMEQLKKNPLPSEISSKKSG